MKTIITSQVIFSTTKIHLTFRFFSFFFEVRQEICRYILDREKKKQPPVFPQMGEKSAKNNHYPQLTTPYYKGQKTKKKPTQLHILTPPAKGLTERKK